MQSEIKLDIGTCKKSFHITKGNITYNNIIDQQPQLKLEKDCK